MPTSKTKLRSLRELNRRDLDYTVNHAPKKVRCSDDLTPCDEIIGQDRAIEAIRLGLNVDSRGYNIFVSGMVGT